MLSITVENQNNHEIINKILQYFACDVFMTLFLFGFANSEKIGRVHFNSVLRTKNTAYSYQNAAKVGTHQFGAAKMIEMMRWYIHTFNDIEQVIKA